MLASSAPASRLGFDRRPGGLGGGLVIDLVGLGFADGAVGSVSRTIHRRPAQFLDTVHHADRLRDLGLGRLGRERVVGVHSVLKELIQVSISFVYFFTVP